MSTSHQFDISKIGFSFVANFGTRAAAVIAAKAAGFRANDVQAVYTRFAKSWIIGEWKSDPSGMTPCRLRMLTKDGQTCDARITRGVSCLGTMHSLLLNI